jgi:hypothetical protein
VIALISRIPTPIVAGYSRLLSVLLISDASTLVHAALQRLAKKVGIVGTHHKGLRWPPNLGQVAK